VRAYQQANGMAANGVVDDSFWSIVTGGESTPETEEELTSILEGDITWYQDPSRPGVWFGVYQMPHSKRRIAFEATEAQMTAIFGDRANWPASAGRLTIEAIGRRENLIFGGSIMEMAGDGTLEHAIDVMVASALENGTLPDWLNNSEKAWDLLYIAETEGKTDEWLAEQWSHLPEFKQRYPGLNKIMELGLSVIDAVTAFTDLEAGLRGLWLQEGRDPGKITNRQVGKLLNSGHSLTSVTNAYAVWNRMRDYQPALDAFNQILVAQGKDPLGKGQMMSFLMGTAPAEMYDIYEASSFQEAANAAGLSEWLDADDAIFYAGQTPGITDLATVTSGMTSAASLLLRLRHELNLAKFGLNHEDLIDVSLGLAPRSGATEADIREAVERAVSEAQGWLTRRVQPYRSYGTQGTPSASSLARARPYT
jgi:hypothetical protein